jgi:hypothetical protein
MEIYRFKGAFIIANVILLAVILSHSIIRDINLEKQYTSDLRNRIVGARLQEDGRDPYFYKWRNGDSYRYLDPMNSDSFRVSNMTSSPALHDLLMPISNFSQKIISVFWLWFQYLLLAVITLVFVLMAKTKMQRLCILNFSILFTCTETWKGLIAAGQVTLLIGFLITLAIYGLTKINSWKHVILAAISTAALILVRPAAAVILIPFIFQYELFYRYLLSTFGFILIYAVFVSFNNKEFALWQSYKTFLAEQVKIHQQTDPEIQKNDPLPRLIYLEGIDLKGALKIQSPTPIRSENGNLFIIYQHLFHKNIPVALPIILFLLIVLLALAGMFIKKINIDQMILLAFLLYLLSEFFSPIHRHQYYAVQWLPLLLSGFLLLKKWNNIPALLIIAGLLLNTFQVSFIPGKFTIGELVWAIALALIIFTKRNVTERT